MNTALASILIVEDDSQIRKFLRISLEAHGYAVAEARFGMQGLELCGAEQPDLVVLDLGLPDIDGREFIGRLREWSQTPVIVLSVRESEADKVQALDAGANDYLTKPFGISELMARIRVLLRAAGAASTEPVVFESGGLRVDKLQRLVSVDDVAVHLSKKEYELLRLLITSPGRVLTHQHILDEVWGPERPIDTHHLRVLVQQLRHKLGDNPTRPRFIVTIQGVGYRFAVRET